MRLKRIYKDEELYDGIWVAFDGDLEIISRYLVQDGGTFEECVFDTFSTIKNNIDNTESEWYQILLEDELIGYLVMSKKHSFIYSLGINVAYRVQRITDIIHGYIFYLSKMKFTHALWAKDNSAIELLKRHSKEIHEEKCGNEAKQN